MTQLTAWSAVLLIVINVCMSSCARKTDQVAEVKAVWTTQMDAWNRGDLEGFMDGYWKSPDVVFFSNGSETRGWQPTLDRYRASYQGEGKHMGTLDFPQLDFKPLGPEAVLVRGRWRLKMPDGKESSGMTSVTFQKLPEGWRIVHDHSSAANN
jgi:beta-aspartyl-peptidase (threonine type)